MGRGRFSVSSLSALPEPEEGKRTMKTRIAILFAVVAALAAATPASAVPAKPVDATSVTLLPVEGTPEALRKMVAAFGKRIADVNTAAETKRGQLQKQMKEGLEKAVAKAQSSGDIDAVLALKAAKEKFETLTTSDVPLVKNAIDFREKKTAEFETARVADALKAAKEFNDELEKAKKDETTKGNFETAKALSDYQKKLAAWAQSIRECAPAPQPARPAPTAVPRPQTPQPVRQQVAPQIVSVYASSADGASIGFAKAGDVFKIQYAGGRWMTGYEIEESPDSPRLQRQDNRCALVRRTDPAFRLATLPANTKQRAFSYTVTEDGEYALRAWDGMNDWSRVYFDDNRGMVRYSVQKISSAGSPSIATAPSSAPSPFVVRQQSGRPDMSNNKKTVSVDATRSEGAAIGFVKAGSTIRIRYLSGQWTSDKSTISRINPDADNWGPWGGLMQTVLSMDPGSQFVAGIPRNTASDPFEFTVDEDATYRLRMKDQGVYDNAGKVQYEVEIIPAGTR